MKKTDLSPREWSVLKGAARGLTDKEIAAEMAISNATIKSYWIRIRQKTGGFNRTEAVATILSRENPPAGGASEDVLLRSVAEHLASETHANGYAVDADGNVVTALTGDADMGGTVGSSLSSALNLIDGTEVERAIAAVATDLNRRLVSAYGIDRQGRSVLFRLALRPSILPSGQSGVLVVATRAVSIASTPVIRYQTA